MKIRLAGFKGEIPRIHPRLLPEDTAQVARNLRLEDGALVPLCEAAHVHSLDDPAQTIYRRPDGTWLSWDALTDAVDGPVANMRTYVTGLGVPRVLGDLDAGEDWPLALYPPSDALSVTPDGVVDDDLSETVFYTYTYVTSFGEESQPALLSEALLISPNVLVILDGWSPAPAGRGITAIRFYRSQTNTLGQTNLHFIREMPHDSVGWTHDLATWPLQELLPSTEYDPPVHGLSGITALANGIMAGFAGKEIYFSEPYRPHAWPTKYALTVDFEIVGLAALGASVVVMTTGTPYVAQGTHPDSMALQRIEQNLPCVSARGIVDLGYSVAYPSTEGVVTVSPETGAKLVTRGLFTRTQWADLQAETFICGQHIGRYIASYEPQGGGDRQIIIIDMTGEQPFLIRSSEAAEAMFFEIGSGRLFLLIGGTEIHEWDSLDADRKPIIWRSRLYDLPSPVNFGSIRVDADNFTGEDPGNSVRVYADGILRREITAFNRGERLPSGFLATKWEVEARGTVTITAISVAQTIGELAVP